MPRDARRRSGTWRAFDPECAVGAVRRCPEPPRIPLRKNQLAPVTQRQEGLAVIVVGSLVTVTVHGPVEIFLEPMRMAVIGGHLQMILDRLEDSRRMGRGRHDGPDHQRQAQKRRKRISSVCPQKCHRSCLSARSSSRPIHGAILFYPPGEDSFFL